MAVPCISDQIARMVVVLDGRASDLVGNAIAHKVE